MKNACGASSSMVGGVVFGGAQLAEQVAQGVQRLFRLVGHAERAGQGDAGADAFFAGGGQLQALFTQSGDPRQADPALGGGL